MSSRNKTLTHHVELAGLDFACGARVLAELCARLYDDIDKASSALAARRQRSRREDEQQRGGLPPAEMYTEGREMDVAIEQARLQDQRDLLGSFALVYLASLFEGFLFELAKCCGWSVREKADWRQRVLLIERQSQYPREGWPIPFQRVEEVFLARNDFLHNRGLVRNAYTRAIREPRFVEDGKICVREKELVKANAELLALGKVLVEKCKPFSPSLPSRAGRKPYGNH